MAALFLFHLALAWYAVYHKGLSITADTGRNYWDYFWQTLPLEHLKTASLTSLWNGHAQPPLFNLLGAVFLHIFGDDFLPRLHLFYTLLGAATCSLTYYVAKTLLKTNWIALPLALLWALNPALPIYEAYILYDIPSLFLIVLTVATLAKWTRNPTRNTYLYLFAALINVLMLTRSLFHAILLPFMWIFLLFLPKTHKIRLLIVAILISLTTLGWYAKNEVQFGFFGASSWSGMNHWRIVWAYYEPEELQNMAESGTLDPMVTRIEAFERPSAYIPYGYTNTSDVAVLSLNDYNNVNIPQISSVFGKNALNLIKKSPKHYLSNAAKAYRIYCLPPTLFKHFDANTCKIETWHNTWNTIMGYNLLKRESWQDGANSWGFYLIPTAFFLFFGIFITKTRLKLPEIAFFIQNNALFVFFAALIAYTTLIGSFFELGENHRIRFIIAPVIWLFIIENIRQTIITCKATMQR